MKFLRTTGTTPGDETVALISDPESLPSTEQGKPSASAMELVATTKTMTSAMRRREKVVLSDCSRRRIGSGEKRDPEEDPAILYEYDAIDVTGSNFIMPPAHLPRTSPLD
jgi:hypothetical protein